MKVSIIIAVYNEASTVAALLERVWAQPLPEVAKEIIIVESNSTDVSRDVVLSYRGKPGVTVILEEAPRGKGGQQPSPLSHAGLGPRAPAHAERDDHARPRSDRCDGIDIERDDAARSRHSDRRSGGCAAPNNRDANPECVA